MNPIFILTISLSTDEGLIQTINGLCEAIVSDRYIHFRFIDGALKRLEIEHSTCFMDLCVNNIRMFFVNKMDKEFNKFAMIDHGCVVGLMFRPDRAGTKVLHQRTKQILHKYFTIDM